MEFVVTIFSVLFIALVLATALTFSVALLIWFVAAAVLIAAIALLRERWRRWRFLHGDAFKPPPEPPGVIEGDYKDISDNHSS